MMTTDEARLAELAHPESEMASLPWAVMTVDEFSHDGWGATRRFIQFDGQPALESIAEVWFGATEAEYIALAANLAPALLAERDALLAQSAALRDQLAAAETLRDGANERVRIVMDAKNHWQERAIAAETELARAEAVVQAARALALRLPPSGAALSFAAVRPWGEYRAALLLNLREALAARTPTPGAAGEVG